MKHPLTLGAILAMLLAGGVTGYTVIQNRDVDIFESSVHVVSYVVDGDTIDIADDVRIRLLGIDAPERGECGYAESRAFLTQLVAGKPIRIEKDITGADQYDRLLRYVYLPSAAAAADDVLVNDALLRAGHARTLGIAPDNRYRDLFATAQEQAKQASRGIWGACDVLDEESASQSDSQPTDPACIIKGIVSAKSFGRNYFYPGCPNYNRIKIDLSKGEGYFCTEAEAREAGFTRSVSCDSTF